MRCCAWAVPVIIASAISVSNAEPMDRADVAERPAAGVPDFMALYRTVNLVGTQRRTQAPHRIDLSKFFTTIPSIAQGMPDCLR